MNSRIASLLKDRISDKEIATLKEQSGVRMRDFAERFLTA